MTWKTGTIKLEAAITVFSGVAFREIQVDGKTVGYHAIYGATHFEDTSLTKLCNRLWLDRSYQPEQDLELVEVMARLKGKP